MNQARTNANRKIGLPVCPAGDVKMRRRGLAAGRLYEGDEWVPAASLEDRTPDRGGIGE